MIQGNYLRWNHKIEVWVLNKYAINEVGSIHTVQGYDLNYCGVIIGADLRYNKQRKEIIADKNPTKTRWEKDEHQTKN